MNLLSETLAALDRTGHTESDVVFVGSADGNYEMSWAEFATLANVDYDNGWGGAEVATDLIVKFSDGTRLWRGEYDGSEWWETEPAFNEDRATRKPIARIVRDADHWESEIAPLQEAPEW
jgi:hypothetical protein